MKVADYIINYLGEQGIKKIFVVYGAANGDLIDAFTRTDKTDYVCVMHEQGGGFAAEGYAKISNLYGVAISTSGPGGQNFVTPIANCFYDSVPCLFITGQVKTRFMRKDLSMRQVGFQETPIVDIVKPITKYAKTIMQSGEVQYELTKALHIMKEGRPGPVLLDIPIDVQHDSIFPNLVDSFIDPCSREQYTQPDFNTLFNLFCQARRPIILIGAGCTKARSKVLALGRLLKCPVIPTWNAIDIVPSDYEWYGGRVGTYGGPGRNFAIQNCDLLLCIGTRISGRITGGNPDTFAREAIKVVVDIDKSMLQPHTQETTFEIAWYSDAREFIKKFNCCLHDNNKELPDYHDWSQLAFTWKEKYDPVKPHLDNAFQKEMNSDLVEVESQVNPYLFMRELSNQCTPNDIIVGDCGGNIVIMNHAFKTKTGQRVITNNGNSPMGFSMAGAIGAWFVHEDYPDYGRHTYKQGNGVGEVSMPKRNVICIIGDGGMNMNIQELQTLINYDINIKIFIINNNIYGITKAFQETNFEGRCEACGPKGYKPPDFEKIAKAYGINYYSLMYGNKNITGFINMALNYPDSIICDIKCNEWHKYEPKIVGWNTPIEDMYPYLDRKEFKENMIIKPLQGWEKSSY